MAHKFDILIFSLFGRNHWLASQLRSSGLSVALMDLTPLFQKGLAEDWEGPFPLIFPDSVARSYSQSFTDQDRSELLNRGPSLRVRGLGLFEFKSDHASYILNRWGQNSLWVSQEDAVVPMKTSELDFQSTWLNAFLKQWRSTTLKSLRDVDTQIPDFPLNANYILRQPSRRGYMESSAVLTDNGVEVLDASQWWRLQQKGNGWELTINENNEVVESKKLILGLTSYELQKFSGQINIPGFNLVTPAAFWVRWRAKTSNMTGLDFIPNYSMFLSDPEFGVYSENMITLIKRSNNDLDVWACLSNESLSNYEFQNSIQKSIEEKLKSFVPELQDLELEDLRMGADLFSFWPLYKNRSLPVAATASQKINLLFDSPESWSALDNYTRYTIQVQLIESLKKELIPATTIGV